jgi:hypothetical protein
MCYHRLCNLGQGPQSLLSLQLPCGTKCCWLRICSNRHMTSKVACSTMQLTPSCCMVLSCCGHTDRAQTPPTQCKTSTSRVTPNCLLSLLEADILLHNPGVQSLCQHTLTAIPGHTWAHGLWLATNPGVARFQSVSTNRAYGPPLHLPVC